MKTKFYWVALLVSAAMIAQAKAGGHHAGGGFGTAPSAAARGGAVSSYHSAPMRSFGGGRIIYSGQRFSSVGMRSPATFPQRYVHSNVAAQVGPRQFTPRNINRGDGSARFSNRENQALTNL